MDSRNTGVSDIYSNIACEGIEEELKQPIEVSQDDIESSSGRKLRRKSTKFYGESNEISDFEQYTDSDHSKKKRERWNKQDDVKLGYELQGLLASKGLTVKGFITNIQEEISGWNLLAEKERIKQLTDRLYKGHFKLF